VKNDDAFAGLSGALASVSLLHIPTGSITPVLSGLSVTLPRGAGSSMWSCVQKNSTTSLCNDWPTLLPNFGCSPSGTDCIALLTLTSPDASTVLAENFILLSAPYLLSFPAAPKVSASVATSPNSDGSVDINISTDATALFVTLTTLAEGRFSDNSIILTPGSQKLTFIPWKPLNLTLLTSSLRLEHMATWGVNATHSGIAPL